VADHLGPQEGVQYLGQVEAPDAESAIKAAIETFGVDEAHRSRLIAQPVK
jgi:hypothetical protein